MIPPKTEVEIDSVKGEESGLEIKLEGEFPPRELDTGENKVEYVGDIAEAGKNDGSSR
jgi:hypothetical protein